MFRHHSTSWSYAYAPALRDSLRPRPRHPGGGHPAGGRHGPRLVYDSLAAHGPLAGAEVWLVGGPYQTVADTGGRFELTGVAAGHYRVAFAHGSLDALALTAPTVEVDVRDGGAVDVTLVTPSDATLYAHACANELRPVGTGLMLGDVTGPAGQPADGAAVRVFWRDWTGQPGDEQRDQIRDATFRDRRAHV